MRERRPDLFAGLNQYVSDIQNVISASAAATYIICRDRVVNEWYSGSHSSSQGSRQVDAESQFNVASIRKTYLGFAVSLALSEGKIKSLDDPVTDYASGLEEDLWEHTTIRHLLSHTHGVQGLNRRVFPPGTGWMYNNTGVNLLIEFIHQLYGKPFPEVLQERVFTPCGFTETGWRTEQNDKLVWLDEQYAGVSGSEANLFASARELACWGYLHLTKGVIKGKQTIPAEQFEQVTTILSPDTLDQPLPRNGFFWFVQDEPRSKSELGEELPPGSFQVLGLTGCACLVIPQYETVAVRMYNQKGPNPIGYDYLEDIRSFGNKVAECTAGL